MPINCFYVLFSGQRKDFAMLLILFHSNARFLKIILSLQDCLRVKTHSRLGQVEGEDYSSPAPTDPDMQISCIPLLKSWLRCGAYRRVRRPGSGNPEVLELGRASYKHLARPIFLFIFSVICRCRKTRKAFPIKSQSRKDQGRIIKNSEIIERVEK